MAAKANISPEMKRAGVKPDPKADLSDIGPLPTAKPRNNGKHPGGRPTKYDPAYCDKVIKYCAEGYSLTAFAGSIRVSRDTITEWEAKHPEFSAAGKIARAARAQWWEGKLRAAGTSPKSSSGRTVSIIFALKNVDPREWSDQTIHRHVGFDGGAVRVERVERMVIDVSPEYAEPIVIEGEVLEPPEPADLATIEAEADDE
jgi:hypothetical protein